MSRYQHDVPEELKPEFDASRVRVADYKLHRLTHAEKTRTLVAKNKSGVLSTLLADEEEATPFGSIINYALDANETVFFFGSKLAEHSTNLNKNPRAALFVYEEKEGKDGDQLAVARATLVGKLVKVEKTKELIDTFQRKHPSANYVLYDDFSVYMFTEVSRVRYIAGFGEMSWVDENEIASARSDPVALGAEFAIKHMNSDHADANLAIVTLRGNLADKCVSATMFALDRFGVDLLAVTESSGKKMVRVLFPEPLENAKQIRDAVVKMSKPDEVAVEEAVVEAAVAVETSG